MTKIENYVWKNGEPDVIRCGKPRTLEVMISSLRSKGIKIYAFKEVEKPAVIIKYKGLICEFVNSAKACEYLYDIYITMQKNEKNEIIKNRLLKEQIMEDLKHDTN